MISRRDPLKPRGRPRADVEIVPIVDPIRRTRALETADIVSRICLRTDLLNTKAVQGNEASRGYAANYGKPDDRGVIIYKGTMSLAAAIAAEVTPTATGALLQANIKAIARWIRNPLAPAPGVIGTWDRARRKRSANI